MPLCGRQERDTRQHIYSTVHAGTLNHKGRDGGLFFSSATVEIAPPVVCDAAFIQRSANVSKNRVIAINSAQPKAFTSYSVRTKTLKMTKKANQSMAPSPQSHEA